MRRLIALIAILFTFASVLGATVAHAHRYVATPIVVLNHVDAHNRSIPVVVHIQRGQIDLGAGLIMPCGNNHAIVADQPCLPVLPEGPLQEGRVAAAMTDWPTIRLLRPPISA